MKPYIVLAMLSASCVRQQPTPPPPSDFRCRLVCPAALRMVASTGFFVDGGMPELMRGATPAGDGRVTLISAVREHANGEFIEMEEVAVDPSCELWVPFARFAKAQEAQPGEVGLRLVIEEGRTTDGRIPVRVEGAELNVCVSFTGDRCHGPATGNLDYGAVELRVGELSCAW